MNENKWQAGIEIDKGTNNINELILGTEDKEGKEYIPTEKLRVHNKLTSKNLN